MKVSTLHTVLVSVLLLASNAVEADLRKVQGMVSKVRQVSATSSSLVGRVTAFRVIDADSNAILIDNIALGGGIANTVMIDLTTLNTSSSKFSVEAITTGSVGSVKLDIAAPLTYSCIDNEAPWALCSNSGDDFFACSMLKEGFDATIRAQPFAARDAKGSSDVVVSFRLVILRTPPPSPQLGLTLINAATNPGIVVPRSPISNNSTIIDLAVTPLINFRADIPTAIAASSVAFVRFAYDNGNRRDDAIAPYSAFGNTGLNYVSFTPTVGCHNISATGYVKRGCSSSSSSNNNNNARVGSSIVVHFCVKDSRTTKAPVVTTSKPTQRPTAAPTKSPTKAPTESPTNAPTKAPMATPTKTPTKAPTKSPTDKPTKAPTKSPTMTPTKAPTSSPTNKPIAAPTDSPTNKPTAAPTKSPTNAPTNAPTATPTKTPTNSPTYSPTNAPAKAPTKSPTNSPTYSPTNKPTKAPTKSPTNAPTKAPTKVPSIVINEIFFIYGPGNRIDWIEIYNAEDSMVDLSGYTMTSNLGSLTFPSGATIQSKKYQVITLEPILNGVTVNYVMSGSDLTYFDNIVIKDKFGQEVDRVNYTPGSNGYPNIRGDDLNSLALKSPDHDNSVGSNWCGSPNSWTSIVILCGSPNRVIASSRAFALTVKLNS